MRVESRRTLQAHIVELEELVEDLLADARSGCAWSRDLLVHLHREVMEKRQRLRDLGERDY